MLGYNSLLKMGLLASLALFFVLFMFLITIAFSLSFYYEGLEKNGSFKKSEKYLISGFNSDTNNTKHGYVTLVRTLSSSEIISFRNSKTHYYTIFGELSHSEFECVGSCYCKTKNSDESNERRASAAMSVGKSLFFMISAFSTFVAFQVAREYFDSECALRFSKDCDSSESVVSEVEKCDAKLKENKKKIAKYFCSGHCLSNYRVKLDDPEMMDAMEKMDCETLVIAEDVELVEGESYHFKYERHGAKRLFRKKVLAPFCNKLSQHTRTLKYNYKVGEKNVVKKNTKSIPLCVAGHKDVMNNINCATDEEVESIPYPDDPKDNPDWFNDFEEDHKDDLYDPWNRNYDDTYNID